MKLTVFTAVRLFFRSVLLIAIGFLLWDVGARLGSGYAGLGVFILLLVGLRWFSRKLVRQAALQREFERKLEQESYQHPDHRPDPDKWIGGAG